MWWIATPWVSYEKAKKRKMMGSISQRDRKKQKAGTQKNHRNRSALEERHFRSKRWEQWGEPVWSALKLWLISRSNMVIIRNLVDPVLCIWNSRNLILPYEPWNSQDRNWQTAQNVLRKFFGWWEPLAHKQVFNPDSNQPPGESLNSWGRSLHPHPLEASFQRAEPGTMSSYPRTHSTPRKWRINLISLNPLPMSYL